MNYQYLLDKNDEIRQDVILRTNDNGVKSFIPNCQENSDWQAYQAWLALGNTPEAGEPIEQE